MAAPSRVIRVASWNVHEGIPAGVNLAEQAIRKEVAALLLEHKVDIIGLQEVDFDTSARSFILETIQQETPLSHNVHNILSDSSFSPTGQAGVALASRYPMVDHERTRFTNPELDTELNGNQIRTHDKGFVSATIMFPGMAISAVSLHTIPFNLFGREADELEFKPMWQEISFKLTDFSARPLVVCGDFNTEQRDLIFTRNNYLTRAVTTEPTHKGKANDDILYSTGLELLNVSVLDNFSDHRLCIVELRVNQLQ